MSKGEQKYIRIILIIIALASLLLLIKINAKPEYDEDLYAQVYAEYNSVMNKNEEVRDVGNSENNTQNSNEVYLIDEEELRKMNNNSLATVANNNNTSSRNNGNNNYVSSGSNYYTVEGEIMIQKLRLIYPVINKTSDEFLKIAPTKLAGPEMNTVGNYCIAGHNYQNDQFFSHLSSLDLNDLVKLTSKNGSQITYRIYAMYEVSEDDLSCTNQNTNGNIETTLITCTKQKDKRLVVKCRAIT